MHHVVAISQQQHEFRNEWPAMVSFRKLLLLRLAVDNSEWPSIYTSHDRLRLAMAIDRHALHNILWWTTSIDRQQQYVSYDQPVVVADCCVSMDVPPRLLSPTISYIRIYIYICIGRRLPRSVVAGNTYRWAPPGSAVYCR